MTNSRITFLKEGRQFDFVLSSYKEYKNFVKLFGSPKRINGVDISEKTPEEIEVLIHLAFD